MAAGVELVPLEPRPFRPFKTSEEYLYAMKEDLAEWLHALYGMDIDVESFMEKLDTGVTLCKHANNVLMTARERGLKVGGERDVVFRPEVQPGTFHARDNVSNFISWCRGALSIKECLLFETDDLVLRKNERSFILCLLEVARKGAQLGMLAPLLVQMEQEIEAEMAQDQQQQQNGRQHHASASSSTGIESDGHEADDDSDTQYEPPAQIITNDLRSLHERVVELLNRCSCPSQFPMIRVADGKYRIGDTQILIFVRILRNHVMVRVGGGWDTLEHYLDKHDPCRCRLGHRFSSTARLSVVPSSSGSINMQVTYNRPRSSGTPSSSRSSSVPTSPPSRRRSFDLTRFSYGEDNREHVARGPSRNSHCSDDSSSCASNASLHILNGDTPNATASPGRTKTGHPSSADSSSEVSENEGKTSLRMGRQRKYSPRKIMRIGENCCDSEDSLLLSSLSPPTSLEFQQQVSSSTGVTDNPQKPVKIASVSPCASDGSNSTCPDDSGACVRKSKIPKSKSPCKKMSYRCYSSEDLSNFKLSASRSEACLITYPSAKCNSAILKGRRASTSGGGMIYGRGSLPRSSSAYHEKGDQGFSLRRSDLARTPLKSLPNEINKSKIDSGCRTWSGRQRSSRSSASPESFRTSSSTRTPPKSPAKNTSDKLCRKQSPIKPVPPLLEEILNDDLLDSDEKILEKMERLINEYRTREDRSQKSQDDDSTLCSASTDECSGADDNGFPSPSRAKNRRKSLNGSPSKIPVYTWQRRD